MKTLHDPGARAAIQARLARLRPDSPRQWGRMNATQMLRHVNAGLSTAVGDLVCKPKPVPLPRPIFKFMALRGPWPKGKVPTAPEFLAEGEYDFEAERTRLLALLERLTVRDLNSSWPEHPAFGTMSGRDWSVLQHRHIHHHFSQFGA